MANPYILGTTGPSIFNPEVKSLVEDYFESIPLYINQDTEEGLEWVLKNINGLILAGGRDVCPISYNEEITNGDSLSSFDMERDKREMYLIKRCFELDIPILGICRGHQMLGVYHGLFLIKDIRNSGVCHNPNIEKINLDNLPCHKIYCLEPYQEEYFKEGFFSSFHHQALFFQDSPQHIHYYKEHNCEILGYAHLTYDVGKQKAQKIVELMRGVNNRFISAQKHLETEYTENLLSQKILDKFKEMIIK